MLPATVVLFILLGFQFFLQTRYIYRQFSCRYRVGLNYSFTRRNKWDSLTKLLSFYLHLFICIVTKHSFITRNRVCLTKIEKMQLSRTRAASFPSRSNRRVRPLDYPGTQKVMLIFGISLSIKFWLLQIIDNCLSILHCLFVFVINVSSMEYFWKVKVTPRGTILSLDSSRRMNVCVHVIKHSRLNRIYLGLW